MFLPFSVTTPDDRHVAHALALLLLALPLWCPWETVLVVHSTEVRKELLLILLTRISIKQEIFLVTSVFFIQNASPSRRPNLTSGMYPGLIYL